MLNYASDDDIIVINAELCKIVIDYWSSTFSGSS